MAHATGQTGVTRFSGDTRINGHRSVPDLIPWRDVVAEPAVAAPSGRWARTLREYGRYAVWALPGYAALTGLASQRQRPVLPLDPDWHQWALMLGSGLLGLVALAGLTGLLAGTAGRRFAAAGLIAGFAGTVTLLPLIGVAAVEAPGAGRAMLRGDWDQVVIADHLRGQTAGIVVLTGAGLFVLAWWLIGVAVLRSRLLSRSDAVLLMIAAPLLYLGGLFLRMLPALGAMLLLAAAIGLAWTAARLSPPSEVEPAGSSAAGESQ